MACVEIEQQISFFSFGFARVSVVRHMHKGSFSIVIVIEVIKIALLKLLWKICDPFALSETNFFWKRDIPFFFDGFQWRIQDFPQGGANSQSGCANLFFSAENCMKMKEFGPPGVRASLAPPLDPPLVLAFLRCE